MAKIKTIKLKVNGVELPVNINCDSQGRFTAKLPAIIFQALNIACEIKKASLSEVETEISQAFRTYRESETFFRLFIGIEYKSSGVFAEFLPIGSEYRKSRYNGELASINFKFEVYMKETVAGNDSWYNTIAKDDLGMWERNKISKDDQTKFFKSGWTSKPTGIKMIPYSDEAYEALLDGQSKLIAISKGLYEFVSQDETMIEKSLLTNKMLQLK